MKNIKALLTVCFSLFVLSSFGQGTQQRVINTTSAFARQILTNETAAQWAAQILLGTNYNFGNFATLNGTNQFTGTNNFSAATIATNSSNFFAGSGAGLTNLAPSNIVAGTISAAISATNTANQFTGAFTGNGAGLTNLAGGGGGVPSGPAGGDLTNTYPNPQVITVGGVAASNVASGANLANAATAVNTPSTIVRRDGSGNVNLSTVTGNFFGNGNGLTNLNIAGQITSFSNLNVQILNLFPTNTLPLRGLISATMNQNFWTNSIGWDYTNSGVLTHIAVGDNFLVNGVHQFLVTQIISPTVVYTFTGSDANYVSVTGVESPNSVYIKDTVPRNVAWIGNDGSIGILNEIDGIANSGKFYMGGGSNMWSLSGADDSSGPAFTIQDSASGLSVGGGAPVVRIYAGCLPFPFDIYTNGVVSHRYGISSRATSTYSMTSTGLTNTSYKIVRVFGFTGTSSYFSNRTSGVNFSLGTITVPSFYTLQTNECLVGTSCAAAGVVDE